MRILVLVFICFSCSLFAEELQENKYYTMGEVDVPENHPASTVLKMIEAFKKSDVKKAKEFCTKEYIKFANTYKSLKFEGTGISDYAEDLDPNGWLKFKLFPPVDGVIRVYIAFKTKDDATATRSYYVKKIDDKWLLVPRKR